MFFRSWLNIPEIKSPHKLILTAILILAAFIYFYNLGRESLTTDEYFSFYLARQPLKNIIFGHQTTSNPNTIPPLYEILLHFWIKIFGVSAFAQRALSAALGITSVYLMYRMGSLLFNLPSGLISAFFASLSFSWFTFFRQNRCYGLFICLALLSFYLFFYLLKNKQSKSCLPILIITNIALVYTNYFGFLIILSQMIMGILEVRDNVWFFKRIMLACFWVILAYLPWYTNLLYDIKKEPLLSVKIYYSQLELRLLSIVITFFADFHIRWEPLLTLLYLPFIARGWVRLHKEKSEGSRYLSLLPFIVYLVNFAIIYSFTLSDRIRYYAAFSFPLFFLLGLGVQKINTRRWQKVILLLFFIFVFVFNFSDFHDFFTRPLNEDWKKATQYIKHVPEYKDKNMIFLFQTRYNPPVFAYYYWDKQVADALIDNIVNYQNYDDDLLAIDTAHKIYLLSEEISDKRLLEKIGAFPDDAWIWLFRYHEPNTSFYLRIHGKEKYFLHQVPLNQELPEINLYLFKRIK